MELLTLGYPVTRPTALVEGWSSLVWNLRYQTPGEFKLETPLIEETMQAIPLGSLVAINEDPEIMIAETHEIQQNENGEDTLTVSGRSYTSVMERRISLDTYAYYHDYTTEDGVVTEGDPHSWVMNHGVLVNDADMAKFIMDKHLTEGMFNSPGGTIRPEVIPNLFITQEDPSNRRYYVRYLERKDLLSVVTTLLQTGNHGLRTRRAVGDNVNTEFNIFTGVNRTKAQSINTPLVFWHEQGHILNAHYLISEKGYYNTFRIFPTKRPFLNNPPWSGEVWTDPARAGIGYRELLVDATEITGEDPTEVDNALQQKLASEIQTHQRTFILDCVVADNIPYVFGRDYNLGDFGTIVGDYGIIKNVQVNEYVKVEDALGERSSPGLSIFQ